MAAFALSPAMALGGLIDYTTDQGQKIFKQSIRKLSEEPFDFNTNNLHLFMDLLRQRADEMGWNEPAIGINEIS